jgi:hypothetical protein
LGKVSGNSKSLLHNLIWCVFNFLVFFWIKISNKSPPKKPLS